MAIPIQTNRDKPSTPEYRLHQYIMANIGLHKQLMLETMHGLGYDKVADVPTTDYDTLITLWKEEIGRVHGIPS